MACGPQQRFRPGFSRFGIRSNGANAAFSGPAVATMYELGNMPRFQTRNGTWPNGARRPPHFAVLRHPASITPPP